SVPLYPTAYCQTRIVLRFAPPVSSRRQPTTGFCAYRRSESYDQAPPCSARGQAPVRLGGLLRRIGGGDAQGDPAFLHVLAEPIELLEFAVIAAHERRGEFDAAFAGAAETAHRGEGATVAHRRNDALVQNRPVRQPVGTGGEVLSDSRSD